MRHSREARKKKEPQHELTKSANSESSNSSDIQLDRLKPASQPKPAITEQAAPQVTTEKVDKNVTPATPNPISTEPQVEETFKSSDDKSKLVSTEVPTDQKVSVEEVKAPEYSEPINSPETKPVEAKPTSGFKSKLSKAKSFGIPSLANLESELNLNEEKPTQLENDQEGGADVFDRSKPANDFTLALLWAAWDEYALKIKEEDKQSYYSTLTKHRPVMKEKFNIEFLVDNHVQKDDLETDKLQLLEFLRDKLNNGRIRLAVMIDEVEHEDGDSLYDPRQKYEAMLKRNPLLANLKEQFDLDIDYDA